MSRPLVMGGFLLLVVGAGDAEEPTAGEYSVRALLEPRYEAQLSAEIAGRLERIPYRDGERFAKGDVLVAFDCERYRAELAVVQAELDAVRKKYQNNTQLAELHSVGALEVELSAAEVARVEAELEKRRLQVERCTVEAPYAGRVESLKVNAHESVAPGDPLLAILDDRNLEIKLLVPSQWLAWLTVGTGFDIIIDETGRRYPAVIRKLGARVDPVSQTLPVTAVIEGELDGLIAGMSGTANFQPSGLE
ncbi:MAG: efflux RND transporter periplasmic adaptor subunit [Pseudomonadota bacterium]